MLSKIKTPDDLAALLSVLRSVGKTIVFTNGCFDIIHTGHTRYLNQAKAYGDILVIGLNSDSSVRGIKGDKRPINGQEERAETLAALACVDFVTIFDEPDPHKLIAKLQPDVLVKGGDWPVEKIIGGDIVQARGGRVISVPYIEGNSTTGIIEKILQKYR